MLLLRFLRVDRTQKLVFTRCLLSRKSGMHETLLLDVETLVFTHFFSRDGAESLQIIMTLKTAGAYVLKKSKTVTCKKPCK